MQGKYEAYAKAMINGNVKYFLKDYEEFLDDLAKNIDSTGFVSEDGIVEKWIVNNKHIVEEAKKQLEDIKINIK